MLALMNLFPRAGHLWNDDYKPQCEHQSWKIRACDSDTAEMKSMWGLTSEAPD